jgi:hypothetical protein
MEPDHRDIQAMTADIVVEEHVRVCVPEPVCHRCFRPWPCGDVQWANEILLREQIDGR